MKILVLLVVVALLAVEIKGHANQVNVPGDTTDDVRARSITDASVDDIIDDIISPSDKEIENDSYQTTPQNPNRLADIPGIPREILDEVFEKAKGEQDEEDERFKKTDLTPKARDRHYARFVPELEPARKRVLMREKMAKHLVKQWGLSAVKQVASLDHGMKRSFNCDSESKFRTVDGSCNNLQDPRLGAANTAFDRLLPPDYKDNISQPRGYINMNHQLPNARTVSLKAFSDEDNRSSRVSHLFMSWGQFVDHDTGHALEPGINCDETCKFEGECFGIKIPPSDPAFVPGTCIELKRNVPFESNNGLVRQQHNQKSCFLDASHIYGDDYATFDLIRNQTSRYLMNVTQHPEGGKHLLPIDAVGFCQSKDDNSCFRSGDFRTTENIGLTSLHTIFLREHNRIAAKLKNFNPGWSDDRVYHETRKILGGIMQHITYNEFLPLLLSRPDRTKFRLDKSWSYNSSCNPAILNAFATAAYRFGHSLVNNIAMTLGPKYSSTPQQEPTEEFFNPDVLYEKEGVDSIVRGFVKDTAQKVDRNFAQALRENLTRFRHDKADLTALNIQRGRDHGLPGYNSFRKLFGLRKANSFEDFLPEISSANIDNLKKVYGHPDDVDLFVGGVIEEPKQDAMIGPTFSCIVGKQFERLKWCDRFWYESKDPHTGFTSKQRAQIKRSSLARLLCDNGDNIKWIPRQPLKKMTEAEDEDEDEGRKNVLIDCTLIKKVDLRKWKESMDAKVQT